MLHQRTETHSRHPFTHTHTFTGNPNIVGPIGKYLLNEVGKETCETTKMASRRQHKRKWEIRNMTRTSCCGTRPNGFLLELNSWAHDECYLQRLFTWNNICHILRTFNLNVWREQGEQRFLALYALYSCIFVATRRSLVTYIFIKYCCTFHCVLSRESETPKAPLIPNEYYSYYNIHTKYVSTSNTILHTFTFVWWHFLRIRARRQRR